MELSELLVDALVQLDRDSVMEYVRQMMERGCTLNQIQQCLNRGVAGVGTRFETGEYFIADLIVSGMIYRDVLHVLMPLISGNSIMPVGRVVIGVAEGDIHDIGKDIVVSLLRAAHFEVIDLGVDVKPDRFLYAVRTYRPDVLLMSGVLTLAQNSMAQTMCLLEQEGLRKQTPVMVGGRCVSEALCRRIGADAWAYDTTITVEFCKKIVEEKYGKNE